jgi:hypothetical protein
MKACPTCHRTYADETLAFCLVDGSILSAPFDPHETLHLPAPRSTDPAPTQLPLPSTIHSPQAPPFLYSEKQPPPLKEKHSVKPWMMLGFAMLVCIVAVGALLSVLWFWKDSAVNNRPDSNLPNTNPLPTATPTDTIEKGGWGPRNDQASINEGERLTYYPGTTPKQCQADCDVNPRCRAFTYIRAGAYNPSDPPMCYLMSEAKNLTSSPCCISAIKR